MYEHVFPLPDGGEWVVRAYHYDTLDEARKVWSHHESSTRGGDWDFSVWAITTPEMKDGLVVFCGHAEGLPPMDRDTYEIPYANAREFALRRARISIDAFENREEGETYFEQRERYGPEHPMSLDEEGRIRPWQKK